MPHKMLFLSRATLLLGLCLAMPLAAQPQSNPSAPSMPSEVMPVDVLNTLIGEWEGKLEYLDYSANQWFGIPARSTISSGGDGVTLIRVSDFDDGPKVGFVRITSISMMGSDGVTEYTSFFRKGRVPELTSATVRVERYTDPAHWVLVSEGVGMDDNRPATLRLTTTREGGSLVTLKEVDFTDDHKAEWLTRNRTTMTAVQ